LKFRTFDILVQLIRTREKKKKKKINMTEGKMSLLKSDFIYELFREEALTYFIKTKTLPRIFWIPSIKKSDLNCVVNNGKCNFEIFKEQKIQNHEEERARYLTCRVSECQDFKTYLKKKYRNLIYILK
jgi:hypothetical protein